MEAAAITVQGVHQTFASPAGDVVALQGIDLHIGPGEFVCLLGPSGCGKSTLLNAIAGFARPTAGRIEVGGRPVTGPGPERGMVFQEYGLFPWMTVRANVAFGLEIQGRPAAECRTRVDELLGKLGLREFAGRFPKDLSGGMRQRVAIARLLALDSPVLLMDEPFAALDALPRRSLQDEPFGALDALTRRSLQDELLRIWAAYRKTIVFVTHAIEESLYLADRVVVLTYRPGTIKEVVPVALPRPRDPTSPEFNALGRRLTALVMTEQARYQRDEGPRAEAPPPALPDP